MSAISTLADYQAAILKPIQRINTLWSTLASVVGKQSSVWKSAPPTGASPAAFATCDNTTAGGMLHNNPGSGQGWIARMAALTNSPGTLMIADRLGAAGGLSGTVTTAQAVQGNTGSGTVTISIASPAVITFASHGYGIGQRVRFTTNGSLPSHIVAGTDYYIIAAGFTTGQFEISATYAGSAINTTGDTQSGTHTCTGQVTGLSRYTDGKGVMAAVEISALIGATARTVTANYTDAEANSAKTTPAIPIGGTGEREVGRFFQFGLAAQDSASAGSSGFKALDQITISATTGTAGDIAVVLYRPLLYLPLYALEDPQVYDAILTHGSNLPEILDNACLMAVLCTNLSGTGVVSLSIPLIET